MNFFLDENLSNRYGPLLSAFDRKNTIECHHEAFDAGIPDADWLTVLGKRDNKPAIICGDGRILSNPAELAALKGAELTFVCLRPGWTTMNWNDQAWKIIRCWPDIVKYVENARLPSVFDVAVNGKVHLRNVVEAL